MAAPDEDDYDEQDETIYADDEICTNCSRITCGEDQCGICGATLCYACFEMGAGVCKGPHR